MLNNIQNKVSPSNYVIVSLFQVIKPTLSKWSESNHVRIVTTGEFHVLYLTSQGHLFSCGSNDVGQLGRHTNTTEGESPGIFLC